MNRCVAKDEGYISKDVLDIHSNLDLSTNHVISSMQLLSVENLSLAAEATVILLLLAIAWHPKGTVPQHARNNVEGISWEPAKQFYLQANLNRGLYLQHWRESQSQNSSRSTDSLPYIPLIVDDDDNRPSMPLPWQDRLTGLLNRQGFDNILKEWLSIEPNHRGDSCLSMVTMSKYSDIVSTHGAMITEQALQQMAKHLVAAFSGESLVARYLPDRFVVLHFASRIAASRKDMEFAQQGMSQEEFFKVAGQPLAINSIVSIIDLHGDSEIDSRMDELEEGTIEAERSGRAIYSVAEGAWTDPLPSTGADEHNDPIGLESKPNENPNAIDDEARNSSAANTLTKPLAEPTPEAAVESNSENGDDEPIASNDISAIANPDDIAALFAQINANKSSRTMETSKPTIVTAEANDLVDVTTLVEPKATSVAIDVSEAASADDIAALFASVKPTVNVTAKPSAPVEQVDLSEAATADDIASLFATVKSAVKPSVSGNDISDQLSEAANAVVADDSVPTSALQGPNSSFVAEPPASPKPSLPIGEALNEAASLDDIESLFAAMKK